jgi:hypothetical protein
MAAPVDVDTMGQPIDSLSREERVRRRAQELYRLRGDRPGSAMDDWLRAEEEIRREAEEHSLRRLFPGQRFSRALRRSAAR